MFKVIGNAWALLLGMMFLMVGNGMQGTMMGVRGALEGFTTFELSLITSAYFLGFLGGSRLAPDFIGRVGHVRVFAALGSMVSAALILYPAITYPAAWILLRVLVGFCFSGLYVTAESWLNNAATNETRGQTLSLYMIVQMVGIVTAQGLLNVADPGGWILFVIPSVLVSISFAPILLSVAPAPAFETTKNMKLRDLYKLSPLGFVGMFLLGSIFAAQFGMSAVYATEIGMSVGEISIFISAIFVGAMVLQYPIGFMSDRMDRRLLIIGVAAGGAFAAIFGWVFSGYFWALCMSAFVLGGMSNPLYALLIAYANDYLEPDDMAAASGGFLFVNGLGAVGGPILIGWIMTSFGADGFWLVIIVLMFAVAAYGIYRMTQRASLYVEEADDYEPVPYAPVTSAGMAIAAEVAQDFYSDADDEDENWELPEWDGNSRE
ncbi:MFS transporter [uncultured Litoreibacter sp.]|uniref:MFS transporter n=1 Tax=uncultured Litoreibacter sp. TaxID=1392394 RepID=UPI0026345F12|nr:MFS transporter [uncultured Litoreibacter sp.]